LTLSQIKRTLSKARKYFIGDIAMAAYDPEREGAKMSFAKDMSYTPAPELT
jgi:hypothetical protein